MSFCKEITRTALLLACFATLAGGAQAQDYLTGSVGWFDLIDQEDEAAQFGLEYRLSPVEYGIRPTIGISVNSDGAVYGYGGFNWDIEILPSQLYVVPNFMVGAYGEGSGKDLGGAIEFRSGLEVDYQLPNTHRVGIAFNHISNASIYDKNPGAEELLINYSVPVGSLFGGR